METEIRCVPYQARNGGRTELTWGQTFIRQKIKRLVPFDEHLNVITTVDITGATSIERVCTVFGSLIRDLGVLRTTYPLNADSNPEQFVHDSGEIPVTCVKVENADEVVGAIFDMERTLGMERFNIEDGPISCFGMVCHRDSPLVAIITASHMTMDGFGQQQLRQELIERLGLASPKEGVDRIGWQAVDDAALEKRDPLAARGEASLQHWRRQLMRTPHTRNLPPPYQPMPERYWHGSMESPALDYAAKVIASRLRISLPSTLYGVVGLLLAHATGDRNPLIIMRISNRFELRDRHAIGHLSQDTPMIFQSHGGSLSDLLKRTHLDALQSYDFGRYDPNTSARVIDETEAEVGDLERYLTFNCMKSGAASSTDAAETARTLSALLGETQFKWIDRRAVEAIKIFIYGSEGKGISVFADTAFMPPAAIRAFAYAFEQILVDAALGEDRVDVLLRRTGLAEDCAAQA